LKEQNTTLQTELDDLLVCLAEQDEKCTSYRKRLRNLGEEVSDEDEDEDEVVEQVEADETPQHNDQTETPEQSDVVPEHSTEPPQSELEELSLV